MAAAGAAADPACAEEEVEETFVRPAMASFSCCDHSSMLCTTLLNASSRLSAVWIAVAALVIAVVPGLSAAATLDLPDLDRAIHYKPRQPLRVMTADGIEIATFGQERRRFVPIQKMPRLLKDAVMAVEVAGGASTVTRAVVRSMFLSQASTAAAERKTLETRIAVELEKQLPKDKILEIYMNELWLGQRAWGFAEASRVYFGKSMNALSLAETAMLAGLPQNPQHTNPISNLDRAVQRQRHVLDRMRASGVINEVQLAAARAEKLVIAPSERNPVFAGHVAEMARLAVVERVGIDQAYIGGITVITSLRAADQRAAWLALRRGVLAHDRKGAWRGVEGVVALPTAEAMKDPLKDYRDDQMLRVAVVTSVSAKALQARLADGEGIEIVDENSAWLRAALSPRAKAPLRIERGSVIRIMKVSKGWQLTQWPQAEAAFVALDPHTGRVRALVGAFDFGHQPFNHVTQGSRQPGSVIKPLLYSAALEHGVMPDTVIDDAPFIGADGWTPANSDGIYFGPITLREALAQSRNTVSVRVLQHTGVAAARDWLQGFGLDADKQPANLTLALGTGSVTPMQLAQAYAVIANGGHRVEPVVIERITDAQGAVLFEAPKAAALGEAQRVIPARNAWLTTSLLGEVTRKGTAARAQAVLKRNDLYGKTGTTNDAVDAWFAGFQPSVVAVAWMGYGIPRSLGTAETGADLALPIWIDYMAAALKSVPAVKLGAPPGGLTRHGDDWIYDEYAVQGYVRHIGTDGEVMKAQPFAAPPLIMRDRAAPATTRQ